MADIFDVVADSTRREMLQILLENLVADSGEMSVSELVARTGLSQPTVSKQLKVLRDAKLVEARYGKLLESMPDGIVLINASGRIVFANFIA